MTAHAWPWTKADPSTKAGRSLYGHLGARFSRLDLSDREWRETREDILQVEIDASIAERGRLWALVAAYRPDEPTWYIEHRDAILDMIAAEGTCPCGALPGEEHDHRDAEATR